CPVLVPVRRSLRVEPGLRTNRAHSAFAVSEYTHRPRCGVRETMAKIVKEFDVRAPPERVFEAVSTPENWPRWSPFVKTASSTGPKTHWVYEGGGMKVESDTETTERRADELFGSAQASGFLKGGGRRYWIERGGERA